jgi:hypothetical protein
MKCDQCKKRTHLEFKCPCGKTCCVACRTPEVHGCTEKYGVKIVLEKVVAEKIEKI